MTFKPIETQEQLDAVLKDRLERAKETARKEVEGELAELEELKKQAKEYAKTQTEKDTALENLQKELESARQTVTDLTGTVDSLKADAERVKVAREVGLPYEMAGRLNGDTYEDLKADAEGLLTLMGSQSNTTAPVASYEKTPADDRKALIAGLLENIE